MEGKRLARSPRRARRIRIIENIVPMFGKMCETGFQCLEKWQKWVPMFGTCRGAISNVCSFGRSEKAERGEEGQNEAQIHHILKMFVEETV